jgi:hypothetical protein
MSAFDDLVGRLTSRLRVDPELQREVAHELRTHLEDTAGEFRAAGLGEPESLAAAAKAMGNETEVADQLWQANRHRMQVRRAVRWAAGATLMPTAVAVSIGVAWSALLSIALVLPIIGFGSQWALSIAGWVREYNLAGLPAGSRLVFEASSTPPWKMPPLDKAEALAGENPEDPVYWAYYTILCLTPPQPQTGEVPRPFGPAERDRLLAALDHGEKIEPDNAFWPMLKASQLLSGSSSVIGGETDPRRTLEYVDSRGEKWTYDWEKPQISDAATFEEGLREYRQAAAKGYLDSHLADFSERRASLLPSASRLSDQLLRGDLDDDMWYLQEALEGGYGGASRRAGLALVDLAAQGQVEQAQELARDQCRLAGLVTARIHSINGLFNAISLYEKSQRDLAMVYKLAGEPARSNEVLAALREFTAFHRQISMEGSNWDAIQKRMPLAGIFDYQRIAYGMDPAKVDLSPGRRADYAASDRLALAVLLVALAAAGAATAMWAGMTRLRTGAWPAMVFVGWRRLAGIVLVSTVLPVAVYAAYARLTPLGGRAFGLWISVERVAVEYAAVACAILVLLRLLSDAAMRRRSLEIGAGELDRPRPGKAVIRVGLLLAFAVVAYLVTWHVAVRHTAIVQRYILPTGGYGLLLAIVVAIHARTWAATPTAKGAGTSGWWQYAPAVAGWAATIASAVMAARSAWGAPLDYAQAMLVAAVGLSVSLLAGLGVVLLMTIEDLLARWRNRAAVEAGPFSYRLSLAPAVLVASLVLAIVVGVPLRLQERQAVAAMNAPGSSYRSATELDQSYFSAIKERLDKIAR